MYLKFVLVRCGGGGAAAGTVLNSWICARAPDDLLLMTSAVECELSLFNLLVLWSNDTITSFWVVFEIEFE